MKKIDLHIHSNFSDDGELTPQEIINTAVNSGLNTISITDHNSVKANNIALNHIKDKPINYISGIEIDCQYNGLNLHLLGYNFDFSKKEFHDFEEDMLNKEIASGYKRLEKIKTLPDLYVDEEKIIEKSHNGIITGELIAEVLLEDKRNENIEMLKPYRENGEKSDMPFVNFYWDYFSQGAPFYVHVEFISLQQAINMIKSNGGLALLAHPGNNLKHNLNLIDEIIKLDIDGIEVYSSYHSKETIDFFYNKCTSNNLLISCGTDFHGKNKPNIKIGDFKHNFNSTEIIFN